MRKYIFEARMEVRDYECDIEGIVNNANYLHYTEHTRHLFLKKCGLSFAEMHEKGVDSMGVLSMLRLPLMVRWLPLNRPFHRPRNFVTHGRTTLSVPTFMAPMDSLSLRSK